MALVACAVCRQPFYASCHDGSCIDAVCPLCEYAPDGARSGNGSAPPGPWPMRGASAVRRPDMVARRTAGRRSHPFETSEHDLLHELKSGSRSRCRP